LLSRNQSLTFTGFFESSGSNNDDHQDFDCESFTGVASGFLGTACTATVVVFFVSLLFDQGQIDAPWHRLVLVTEKVIATIPAATNFMVLKIMTSPHLYQLPFKSALHRMFTLRENMLIFS
jgi:hypothetical protein